MPRTNKVENNVQETVETVETAETVEAVKENKKKTYVITVVGNPSYCGIGAGGVQFANGEAHITSDRMAEWFREHNGYEVTEA